MTDDHTAAGETTWVFNLESCASLLIALGGILASLATRGALVPGPALTFLERCFFPLQLPVFYLAYGYLYQRQWRVSDPRSWGVSMGRELVYMLVPLAAVTVPTLLVDGWAGTGAGLTARTLGRALLVEPVIPVGFFLVALCLYALVPTFSSRRRAAAFVCVAAALKAAVTLGPLLPGGGEAVAALPYAAAGVCDNGLWFCAGMALARREGLDGRLPRLGSPAVLWAAWAGLALGLFCALEAGLVGAAVTEAVLTAAGLWAACALFSRVWAPGRRQWRPFALVDGYTKGIWLMHPMFLTVWFHLTRSAHLGAAALAAGTLAVAYVAPVLVNMAMDRVPWLGFLVNPNRYLKVPPKGGAKGGRAA